MDRFMWFKIWFQLIWFGKLTAMVAPLACCDLGLNLSLALDHPARNHHNRDRPNRIQKKMAISITRP